VRIRAVLALGLVVAAPASAATPQIQSHRGGAERDGKPTFAEESMAGLRSAWEQEHTVLELDVKLAADRVPVVIHDATLDRTTICSGRVDARTWADLRAHCASDVLGIDPLPRAKADPLVPMASLAEVLAYAKASGAPLNIEIKNIPGEPDFDPTSAYADTVLDTIAASGVPASQLIIQSFWPPNLDEAQRRLPRVATAFLTSGTGIASIIYSAERGYTWWSPAWPVTEADVDQAHAAGLKVVPWTIDTSDGIRAAADAGVDAIITNDPVMAKRALGLPAGTTTAVASGGPAAAPAPPHLTLVGIRMRRRGRVLLLRLRADGPGTAALRAFLPSGKLAARGSVTAHRAGVVTARLLLTPAGRRALRDHPRTHLRVLGRRIQVAPLSA
jgi:glycerophosphoryl diester phosphodiesterase